MRRLQPLVESVTMMDVAVKRKAECTRQEAEDADDAAAAFAHTMEGMDGNC